MYLRGQKQPIKVKIMEVGIDEIKYKYWPVQDDAPVQVIAKDNVSRIVMEKGDSYSFAEGGMNGQANYEAQKKNAFKVAFLSPLFGHLGLSYERSIRPGRSYEIGLGIIGAGAQYTEYKSHGVFAKLGYKFISSPDYYLRGMRYAHVLKGFYAKPEITLGYYATQYPDYYYNAPYPYGYGAYTRDVTFGGMQINIGKQWVFDDAMLLDMYLGVGYGFSVYNGNGNLYEYKQEIYHYAFVGGHEVFPIALSAGIKIGFLTGKTRRTGEEKTAEK